MTTEWLEKGHLENILKETEADFARIIKFSVVPGSGAGENYSSVIYRLVVEIELKDGSLKSYSYMLKLAPEKGSDSYDYIKNGKHFVKENIMYKKIIPEFEKLYFEKGVQINFGPRNFNFPSGVDKEYVLTEDLRSHGFLNANRLEGLDENHCKAALEKLAKFHAASAVFYEKHGPFSEDFNINLFVESSRSIFLDFNKHIMESMEPCIRKLCQNGEYFADKFIKKDISDYVKHLFDSENINYNEFNVLNHGDFWVNNILFQSNGATINETKFIDFQISKYGSPALDLYYFILSSAKLELKVKNFDDLIQFYYDHLIRNLELLDYPKEKPSLSNIHKSLLSHGIWARLPLCGVLAAALLDPNENANMDNFMGQDNEDNTFKSLMYSNKRYISALDEILPWLDSRGTLNKED